MTVSVAGDIVAVMTDDRFEQIRKLESSYHAKEHPVAKTYEGELLGGVTNPYFEQLSQLTSSEIDQLAAESSKRNVEAKRTDQFEWSLDNQLLGSNLDSYHSNITKCRKCSMVGVGSCQTPVFYEPVNSKSEIKILFVGDIPKPFQLDDPLSPQQVIAGKSRELLDRMIEAMRLKKGDFAITLLSKCYSKEEQDQRVMLGICRENLLQEIALIKPQVVVTLGAMATNSLLEKDERLTNIHGKFLSGTVNCSEAGSWNFKIVPIFHPDYLLINPAMKRTAWIDMQKIMEFLQL